MPQYIFIHGKNARLSRAELSSVFSDAILFQHDQFSLLETQRIIDQKLLNTLGGTIKIASVISKPPEEFLASESRGKKLLFALSQYGGDEPLQKILQLIKESLRKNQLPARFLNKEYSNMSSGQLNQSRLLQKGVDLTRCWIQGKWLYGKTIAFQDIDAYSMRDYEKPVRDMKTGMMPPKLAQMMINFSGLGETTAIYDPFCGVGTILLEGLLRGNPVMASDIKERMVEATKRNLMWVKKTFRLEVHLKEEFFFHHDATTPYSNLFPKDFVIVTEGYLGPPLLRFPNEQERKLLFTALHQINGKFFHEASKILSPGKKLIMCFPYFRSGSLKDFYPEIYFHHYASEGLEVINPFRSLLYEREHQVVGREVIIFQKK